MSREAKSQGRSSAGRVSSDGGLPLLRQTDLSIHLSERLARCFVDHRNPELVEHTVPQLIAQRVYGPTLGYEDLDDHQQLGCDPLLAAMAGKADPQGQQRRHRKDRGRGLASPSTLGRIERTTADAGEHSRYAKIVCNFDKLRDEFVDVFIASFEQVPQRLVLDIDPTDIPLHGNQEQRFYHEW